VSFNNFIQVEKENEKSGMKVHMDYEFVDHLGKTQKGSLDKLYPAGRSSQYETIELGQFKSVDYSISLSIGSSYVKAINRLDYRRK
jgi:hypothetical protein